MAIASKLVVHMTGKVIWQQNNIFNFVAIWENAGKIQYYRKSSYNPDLYRLILNIKII
mgnify:CR=1 FL=1